MKKYLLILAAILAYNGVFAQKQLTQYLFPEFKEGSVLQKSGTVTKTQLNYNTLTQEMIFKQGEQFLALDKIQEIDTVYLNNKKFVPGDNLFYEIATQTPVALLLQHTSDIMPSGNETGFGKSQTTAVTNITDLKRGGRAYSLSLPDEYSFKNKTACFLKKEGKYILITNIKDIKKVFADKESVIEDYTKKNKVNFKKPETVAALIEFCNSN